MRIKENCEFKYWDILVFLTTPWLQKLGKHLQTKQSRHNKLTSISWSTCVFRRVAHVSVNSLICLIWKVTFRKRVEIVVTCIGKYPSSSVKLIFYNGEPSRIGVIKFAKGWFKNKLLGNLGLIPSLWRAKALKYRINCEMYTQTLL